MTTLIYHMDRWHVIESLRNLLRGTDWMKEALEAFHADDVPGVLAVLAIKKATASVSCLH